MNHMNTVIRMVGSYVMSVQICIESILYEFSA